MGSSQISAPGAACTAKIERLVLQKIEEPVRTNFPENTDSGAQNFGPKQSEADQFLKSKTANPDTEVLGTEVGVADAMRFKGAGESTSGRVPMSFQCTFSQHTRLACSS